MQAMRIYPGRVLEMVLGQTGQPAAKIACSPTGAPAAGQYVIASPPVDQDGALGAALFLWEAWGEGFLAASPVPASWFPGISLALRGPLGHGFRLPGGVKRLALAALGETSERLMPVANQVLSAGGDVALFADLPLTPIPAALEFYPLAALPEALLWADFLAVDLPLEAIAGLGEKLGISPGASLPCPGQALALAPMPCGGAAACGACAVPVRRGWKLACEDGPVFDLADLLA